MTLAEETRTTVANATPTVAAPKLALSVTPEAVTNLRSVIDRTAAERGDVAIRVYVQAARGNQVAYGMGLDDSRQDGDEIIEIDGVRIIVDADSAPYVNGSEISYVDSLMGRGFTIQNPSYEPLTGGGCCGGGGGGGCGCSTGAKTDGETASHNGGGCGCGN